MCSADAVSWELERSWAVEPFAYWPEHPPNVQPREYQAAGVEYALARDNCVFGDEPGLGKTAQCILTSNAMEAKRNLVIAPASLRLNWEREVWMWSTIPNVKTHVVLKGRDGIAPWAHYNILSYDILRNENLLDAILDYQWDHLILDEGHYLKDPKGNKRIRPICAENGIASYSGRISLATGTLMPNQPIECYNAVRLLDWSAIDFASLEEFREHYYDYGEGWVTKFDPVAKKWRQQRSSQVRNVPKNLDDLRTRLRTHVMVRRLKADVLKELPARQWHLFPVEPNAEIRRALEHEGWAIVNELHSMEEGIFDAEVPIDGAVSTARRLLGEAKAPAMARYIKQLLVEGIGKVVVSAWHKTVLRLLWDELASEGGWVYMDGSTSNTAKQRAVDSFQQNSEVVGILGQMMPLSKGWTLTAAQHAVLCEPYWTPGENVQFLDRIHRFGQSGGIVIGHVPVVPDTLDERVLAAVIKKGTAIAQALDGRN